MDYQCQVSAINGATVEHLIGMKLKAWLYKDRLHTGSPLSVGLRAAIFAGLTPRRKKLLIGFGSFVGLVAAFLILEHFRGGWALSRWKARMAAKGERLSVDKLEPAPIPADENGMPQLLWVAGQLGSFPNDLQPPAGRYAGPGKWVLITRMNGWREFGAKRTNATWVEVAENLSACESRIEAALEALQSSAFNANLFYRGGLNGMSFNHLARIKSLSIFLSTAALHDLHQYQTEEAYRKLQGLFAVPNVLKGEPAVISQLVRIATMQISVPALWQALQCDGWSDAQLAALQDAWSAHDFLRGMDHAFAMERACGRIEFERMRSSATPLSDLFGGTVTPTATPSLLSWDWVGQMFDPRERIFAPIWRFAWSEQDELHYSEVIQAVLEAHREAEPTRTGATVIAAINKIESQPMGPYDYCRFLISRLMSASVSKSLVRAWMAQTTAEVAKTAIAIKRYQLREGELPTTLAALVPEFLENVPIDYMDGKPLRYCLEADGSFLLYSVGEDGRDGHGDATSKGGGLHYQMTRDLVWPRRASDLEVLSWNTLRR